MAEMKQSGPHLARTRPAAVVFGMPKEAIALGCVDRVVPLHNLTKKC